MAKKEKEEEQLTPQQQKMKALMAAMQKIEKDFGKGSIMKMGDEKIENVEVIPTGSIATPRDASSRFMVLSRQVRPHWLSTPSLSARRMVALPPSSMLSMPSTASMRRNLASILTTSISHSLTMVSRPWRLPTS